MEPNTVVLKAWHSSRDKYRSVRSCSGSAGRARAVRKSLVVTSEPSSLALASPMAPLVAQQDLALRDHLIHGKRAPCLAYDVAHAVAAVDTQSSPELTKSPCGSMSVRP